MSKQAIVGLVLSSVLSSSAMAGPYPQTSIVDAVDFASHAVVPGGSTLVRNTHSVDMTFHTTGLEPSAVYTAWWVIFNKPEYCFTTPCGADDLRVGPGTPETALMWAAGQIVNNDGTANFSASLRKHRAPGEVLMGRGLEKVRQAEIHIVLRGHGQPIVGLTAEQLGSFAGGCDVNACLDEQAAVHLPAN